MGLELHGSANDLAIWSAGRQQNAHGGRVTVDERKGGDEEEEAGDGFIGWGFLLILYSRFCTAPFPPRWRDPDWPPSISWMPSRRLVLLGYM